MRGNFWISQGIEGIRGFHRVSQGFERRVGLPPFVGGLRLRGFASLESRVCRLEHLRGDSAVVKRLPAWTPAPAKEAEAGPSGEKGGPPKKKAKK